jgi:predicted dehydrogenase
MASKEEVGVGIIGYSIGKAHAHAWSSLKEYYYPAVLKPTLAAICGRTREKVDIEAKRFGFKKTYSDWKDLVEDPAVEIVDNCASPSSHVDPVVKAAEMGKNVFCEKPLARNSKEAKSMLEAAEKAHVKHMTGFNYRFVPAIALAKEMVDNGSIGKVYYFKGSYLNVEVGYDDPDLPIEWHHESKIAGYGALSDLGSHALDLARFLVGEISSVCGANATFIKSRPLKPGSTAKGKVDVDDLTIACLKFKDGALGVLEASWITPGRTDFLGFEIYGSLGTMRFNLERINELELYTSSDSKKVAGFRNVLVLNREHPYMKQYWPNQGGGFSWEHTFVNELNHYLNCISQDELVEPVGATFYDGYRNCLIMDAIVESSKTEKWVSLPN